MLTNSIYHQCVHQHKIPSCSINIYTVDLCARPSTYARAHAGCFEERGERRGTTENAGTENDGSTRGLQKQNNRTDRKAVCRLKLTSLWMTRTSLTKQYDGEICRPHPWVCANNCGQWSRMPLWLITLFHNGNTMFIVLCDTCAIIVSRGG